MPRGTPSPHNLGTHRLRPQGKRWLEFPPAPWAMGKLAQGRRGLPEGLAGKPPLPPPPHATPGAPEPPGSGPVPQDPEGAHGGVEADSPAP